MRGTVPAFLLAWRKEPGSDPRCFARSHAQKEGLARSWPATQASKATEALQSSSSNPVAHLLAPAPLEVEAGTAVACERAGIETYGMAREVAWGGFVNVSLSSAAAPAHTYEMFSFVSCGRQLT